MAIFKLSDTFLFSHKKKTPVVRKKISSSFSDERQEALDDLTRLFPSMACGEVQEIKKTFIDARTLYEPKKTKKVKDVLPLLERMKKQSILFGYPLVADVITHLEKIIQKAKSFSEPEFTLMHNDVLLLQEILWKKIKGDGGEKGRKILNQLTRIPK